jgi:poly(beta-D-mannuronate) lyase
MKAIHLKFLVSVILLFSGTMAARNYTVSDASQFNALNLRPCDVVTWANGTYSNQNVVFNGAGVAGNPIILKAETPGGVIFTGSSEMNIYGDHMIIDGFYWNGGIGTNNHVEFRRSGSSTDFARNTIFRNCAFNDLQTVGDDKSRWIVLYGSNNTVENCSFLNKNSTGVYLLVALNHQQGGVTGHIIRNNYFYNVTPKDGRLNAGDSEGIRIGSSSKQSTNASVLVEGNYFKEVNGENEIISNKSVGNIYRGNTFRSCRGSLVLRHGAQVLVERNYFMGENKLNSGGIRVSDQDHVIINNYMQELDNSSSGFNNGITLMGGSAVSGGTSNGYQNVSNVLIAFNTIYNSINPIHFNDSRGSAAPGGIFANNLVYSDRGTIVTGDISQIGGQMNYVGNIFGGSNIGITNTGIINANPNFIAAGEIVKPDLTGPVGNAALGNYPQVMVDIEGFGRPALGKDVGAHEVLAATSIGTNFQPINDVEVGQEIGVCYLNAQGLTTATTCASYDYSLICAPVSVTGVTSNPETATLAIGTINQLNAVIVPSNASNMQVSWSSSDSDVATVSSNGIVTAVSLGNSTITATTANGSFTDTSIITVVAAITPPDCMQGTNLALDKVLSSFSDEQAVNVASNAIDGDTDNRWSARNFPQDLVIDLGAAYYIGSFNLHPYQSRDYQYLIEGSVNSPTARFTTIVDRQNNTQQSAVISDVITPTISRYIRLTVTGANTYSGPWVSSRS